MVIVIAVAGRAQEHPTSPSFHVTRAEFRIRRYPSDTTDAQWTLIDALLPTPAWLAGQDGRRVPTQLPAGVVVAAPKASLAAAAEGALNRLDEVANRQRGRELLAHLTRLLDLQAAAGLDGIRRPLRKVLMVDLPGRVGQTVDKRLLPYLRADLGAIAAIAAGEHIDVALLSRTSSIMAGLPDDGLVHWRTDHTWCGHDPENAVIMAAPPGPELENATRHLCDWLRAQHDMPRVVLLALVHFQLTRLTPFPGGNHLSRLYIVLQLIKDGLLRDQILPVAPWVYRQRDKYWASFRDCVAGDLDSWVAFIATCIQDACYEQIRLINEIEKVRASMLERFVRKDHFLEAIRNLSGYPVLNGLQLATLQEVNSDYAGELINKLLGENLVKRMDRKTGLWIEGDDEGSRYSTVVGSPAILEILERRLAIPDGEDSDSPS